MKVSQITNLGTWLSWMKKATSSKCMRHHVSSRGGFGSCMFKKKKIHPGLNKNIPLVYNPKFEIYLDRFGSEASGSVPWRLQRVQTQYGQHKREFVRFLLLVFILGLFF
jgi:hypothetical protein